MAPIAPTVPHGQPQRAQQAPPQVSAVGGILTCYECSQLLTPHVVDAADTGSTGACVQATAVACVQETAAPAAVSQHQATRRGTVCRGETQAPPGSKAPQEAERSSKPRLVALKSMEINRLAIDWRVESAVMGVCMAKSHKSNKHNVGVCYQLPTQNFESGIFSTWPRRTRRMYSAITSLRALK